VSAPVCVGELVDCAKELKQNKIKLQKTKQDKIMFFNFIGGFKKFYKEIISSSG
jgi:hypothetical protein